MLYQDIPRIYTAIAEWGSCLVYLYILKKENMKSVHFLAGSLFMLAIQSIFLTLTDNVTEILWIPCRACHHHTEMDATHPERPHAGTFREVRCGYLRYLR